MGPFNMPSRLFALLIAFAAIADVSAQSPKIYRCVDAKGKTYVTQTPPPECLGKTTQELSSQGRVVRENKVLTPEQLEAQEAEKKQKAGKLVSANGFKSSMMCPYAKKRSLYRVRR